MLSRNARNLYGFLIQQQVFIFILPMMKRFLVRNQIRNLYLKVFHLLFSQSRKIWSPIFYFQLTKLSLGDHYPSWINECRWYI